MAGNNYAKSDTNNVLPIIKLFSLIHTVIRFTPQLERRCYGTCYGIIFYFHMGRKNNTVTAKCVHETQEHLVGQMVALPIQRFSLPSLLSLCFTENIYLVKASVHQFIIWINQLLGMRGRKGRRPISPQEGNQNHKN